MKIINPKLCLICKGRLFCKLNYCPILLKKRLIAKNLIKFRKLKNIEGLSISFFASWRNYPNVKVGVFTGEEYKSIKDFEKMKIEEVASYRVSLILGREKKNIANVDLSDKLIEIAGSKPIYINMEVDKLKKVINFSFDYYPIGLHGNIKSIETLDTPKIPRIVEKLYYDEIKANDAVITLYKRNFPYEKIQELFSSGYFGIKKKIVPTRWAITAVDGIIGNYLKEKILQYQTIEKAFYGIGELFGNIIEIYLIPGPFTFVYIERYLPKANWNVTKEVREIKDVEILKPPEKPRTAGAFYASRLPIFEYLEKIKRKCYIKVVRTITSNYIFPLGVWVVREATRKAIENLKKMENVKVKSINDYKVKTPL